MVGPRSHTLTLCDSLSEPGCPFAAYSKDAAGRSGAPQPAPKRPTEYTKEIGETICGRLVEDENLRSICAEPEMPDVATVSNWISNNGQFRDMYALAREFQAHCIADEVIELADEVSTEWVEKVRANGRVVRGPDRKNLPRCRLRNEVRHWVAEQLLARARQLSARTLFDP
jgi:hypothetical protein